MTPPATPMDQSQLLQPIKRFLPAGVEDEQGFMFPNPKKVARTRTGTGPSPGTETKNRFQPLRNEQNGQEAPTKPKRHPPIILRSRVDTMTLRDLMTSKGFKDFSISPGPAETRVFLGPSEDHQSALALFLSQGWIFYTYAPKGSTRRTNRFTIRGLDISHPIESIREALAADLPGYISAQRLSRTNEDGTKVETSTIMVVTEAGTKEEQVKKVGSIDHVKIRVGSFKSDGGPVQCHNCQELGHTKRYCWLYATCVRCGSRHQDETCPTPQAQPKCRNCGGAHVASWRGCPARQQLKRKEPVKPPQYIPAPPPAVPAWQKGPTSQQSTFTTGSPQPTASSTSTTPSDGMPQWAQHLFGMLTTLMQTITQLVNKIGSVGVSV